MQPGLARRMLLKMTISYRLLLIVIKDVISGRTMFTAVVPVILSPMLPMSPVSICSISASSSLELVPLGG